MALKGGDCEWLLPLQKAVDANYGWMLSLNTCCSNNLFRFQQHSPDVKAASHPDCRALEECFRTSLKKNRDDGFGKQKESNPNTHTHTPVPFKQHLTARCSCVGFRTPSGSPVVLLVSPGCARASNPVCTQRNQRSLPHIRVMPSQVILSLSLPLPVSRSTENMFTLRLRHERASSEWTGLN